MSQAQAALGQQQFGQAAQFIYTKSVAEIFDEVERERADYGVVPIENSTEGVVNLTLDMFIESPLQICAEVMLEISHSLLSKHERLEDIKYIVGTGYGRINVPFAQKPVTEIACHARGANFIYGPTVRTVLDMGGQDCKAIRCDEKGKVTAFLMNDTLAIIGTPMVLLLSRKANTPPKVMLLSLAFAVTVGSAMSPIGNPQNLLIAVNGGIRNENEHIIAKLLRNRDFLLF
jgi:hypothetical protein